MTTDVQIMLCKLAAIILFTATIASWLLGGSILLGLNLLAMEMCFVLRVDALEET